MTSRTFPAGVFPEPLSLGGTTYMGCVHAGRGLVMRKWPDGRPDLATEVWVDPLAFTKGYLRMWVVDGLPLALYYRDEPLPSHVLVCRADVADADGHPVPAVPWRIAFNGNNPAGWGTGGLLAVQDTAQFVLTSQWPDTPVIGPMSRPGNAMGISRFDLDNLVEPVRLWTDDDPITANAYGIRNPQWLPDGTIIGDGQNGGVGFVIDGVAKFLDYGETRNTPRGCRQANGRFTTAWWDKDARSVSVACDIDEAELWTFPVVEPFDRPKFVGVIWGSSEQYGYDLYSGNLETLFGAYPGWASSNYLLMQVKRHVIDGGGLNIPEEKNLGDNADSLTVIRPGDPRKWRYSDARVYQDGQNLGHRPCDVRLLQAYPLKGESVINFQASMLQQLSRFEGQKGIVAKFYAGNPPEEFSEQELDPFFRVYERLLRLPDCFCLLAFDGSRSGIKYHPRWRMWLDAFAAAAGPTLPALVPVPKPPQPTPPVQKGFGGPVYDYWLDS